MRMSRSIARRARNVKGGLGFVRRSHYTLHGASPSFRKLEWMSFTCLRVRKDSNTSYSREMTWADGLEGRSIVNNSAATVAKFLFEMSLGTDAWNGSLSTAGQKISILHKSFSSAPR